MGLQEKKKIKKKFENRLFQIARFLGEVPLKSLKKSIIVEYRTRYTLKWPNGDRTAKKLN